MWTQLRPVGVVNPGFFFRKIPGPSKIGSGSQPRESELLKFFNQFSYRASDSGMGSTLDREGFVRDLCRVSGRKPIHEDGTVKISIAWIDAFNLVFLDEPFLPEG